MEFWAALDDGLFGRFTPEIINQVSKKSQTVPETEIKCNIWPESYRYELSSKSGHIQVILCNFNIF